MGFASVQSFAASGAGRSWQGCATDGTSVWVTTDRTVRGFTVDNLSNCIETYNQSGVRQAVHNAVYTGTVGGKLWNFVDATYYDGHLYVCCTNWHSNASVETACQILKLDATTLAVVATYPLTPLNGSIESIARRGNEWWVCWSGSANVRRYNDDFSTLIGTYTATPQSPLLDASPAYGDNNVKYYQGIVWVGDICYLSLHGANNAGDNAYAPGVEVFKWDGSAFTYRKTIPPPTYGSGQGMCRTDAGKWWFADRSADTLVSCDLTPTKTATALSNASKKFQADCSRTWTPIPHTRDEVRAAFDEFDASGDHNLTLGASAQTRFTAAFGAF